MKCNVGTTDRVLRITGGLAIIVWGFLTHNWWGAVGVVPILTGSFRFCPAYLPFGISTSKDKEGTL